VNVFAYLFILVLAFALVCWMVAMVPLPARPPHLRSVLYVLVALVGLAVLFDLLGWVDMGLRVHVVRVR